MKLIKKILIFLNIVVLFILIFISAQKEESYKNRQDYFYLKLAPVDPRSLMQGDYMTLNYDITDKASSILYNIRYDYEFYEDNNMTEEIEEEKVYDNTEVIAQEETITREIEDDEKWDENIEKIEFVAETKDSEIEIKYNREELKNIKRGYLVIVVDKNKVGQLVEIVKEKYGDERKLFIPFKYNDWSLFINANSYLFQEGEAERYEEAMYSKVILTDKFLRLLDLVDKNFNIIK